MSAELSDQQLDILLSSADGFVGQGGDLVAELAGAVRQLRRSLVTVSPSGKTFRLDRLAECEDALDTWQSYAAAAEAERDQLAAIVRDLATCESPTDDEHGVCLLCEAPIYLTEGHNESCAWRRAREWAAAHPEETP